ncbi:MAG: pyruvate, phosphate dikinase [Alphaproteobacteria bacterium]|nr:pyruvate, phosphate dikinase [Alphaproteobacteria bacterium]
MANTAKDKWVYDFGAGKTDGSAEMRNLLGGKGANLAEMASLDLPVPPGFTITTEVCTHYYGHEHSYPESLKTQVETSLKRLEKEVGATFGDAKNPLLVSVRSGARVSMPGMMDTVLNLGLNDDTVKGLEEQSGDTRFAWDSYRRFIQMYGDVVLGVDHHKFETIIDAHKAIKNISEDVDVTAEGWKSIVASYKELVENEIGRAFPMDPHEQLWGAISAVFESWDLLRARRYRRINDIPDDWGTAVNVQTMVFGNMGEDCATGVCFTRDPSNGEKFFYGEFLINAQGEDVVAGIRTPQQLTIRLREKEGNTLPSMEEAMPKAFKELCDVREKLEAHYREMQDIEFTVQKGTLYMLQTRSGKRTAAAALKIAIDMVEEGLISKDEAVMRVDPGVLDQLLHPMIDPKAAKTSIGKGLPASPGAAYGRICFNADDTERWAEEGKSVILVRIETSPEDIHGMHAAKAILTTRGGMTSHAAVVARGMGRACVAGAADLFVDYAEKTLKAGNEILKEGDYITVDGSSGHVYKGRVDMVEPDLSGDFDTLMEWADKVRRLGVRTNAETVTDIKAALEFGASGIGLARTEHMFFDAERIQNVREMIFAANEDERRKALDKLLPAQRADFSKMFALMQGMPVTVRLLDPPLHEFLPHGSGDIAAFAKAAGLSPDVVEIRLTLLKEANPMLGHRGCRLGISYPEIYEMQARAIFEGALAAGGNIYPEIMVPLVMIDKELEKLKAVIDDTAEKVFEEQGKRVDYMVGTMIELPRAAVTADEIAAHAEFFSFGTNDLTQTTMGLSRDDSGMFLPKYVEDGVLPQDPFVSLDQSGVGALMEIAAEKGRKARKGIKLGICGEHGGDPASIDFCERLQLDYVSCSPYRVPIARLAAAQAALRYKRKNKVVSLQSA